MCDLVRVTYVYEPTSALMPRIARTLNASPGVYAEEPENHVPSHGGSHAGLPGRTLHPGKGGDGVSCVLAAGPREPPQSLSLASASASVSSLCLKAVETTPALQPRSQATSGPRGNGHRLPCLKEHGEPQPGQGFQLWCHFQRLFLDHSKLENSQ